MPYRGITNFSLFSFFFFQYTRRIYYDIARNPINWRCTRKLHQRVRTMSFIIPVLGEREDVDIEINK